MATNYLHAGDVVDLHAPVGGVTSGTPIQIGDLLVIPTVTALVGVQFNGYTTGVWTIVKAAGEAWTEGQRLYWDGVAQNFTTTALGNFLAGVALADADLADTTGTILLMPGSGTADAST